MRFKFTLIITFSFMIGCASQSVSQNTEMSKSLLTTFEREDIKLGWECKWITGVSDATCVKGNIKYIEVTGYAPSNGNWSCPNSPDTLTFSNKVIGFNDIDV